MSSFDNMGRSSGHDARTSLAKERKLAGMTSHALRLDEWMNGCAAHDGQADCKLMSKLGILSLLPFDLRMVERTEENGMGKQSRVGDLGWWLSSRKGLRLA